jgi:anhydro-N-acetylmuramic acid kinase
MLGLMSGTSADGIDAVIARIGRTQGRVKAKIIEHVHFRFPPKLRERILRASLHGKVNEICELNFELGEQFARAALKAIQKAGLKSRDIYGIGSHGQTVHHLPGARFPSTFQIGEPSVIAERTGITTVADFRVRDMAAGGQGAPLVPFADWALFAHPTRPRIIQNIGGIGNLTYLPAGGDLSDVVAWDTGPGNMIIDGVMQALTHGEKNFDSGGQMAGRGKVSEPLLRQLLKHPFLEKSPPKTTGREEFGEQFLNKVLSKARKLKLGKADVVASVTAFTARSIADNYKRWIFPKLTRRDQLQVVIGGGGAKNKTLLKMLAQAVPFAEIMTHEQFGINNSAKEALAFAIMAFETLAGRPSNVPGATGAWRACVLGKIVPGNFYGSQRT